MVQPKNFHYYKFNDGTKVQMGKLKQMTLDLFQEGQELKIPEISKLMNLREDTVIQVVSSKDSKQIGTLSTQKNQNVYWQN